MLQILAKKLLQSTAGKVFQLNSNLNVVKINAKLRPFKGCLGECRSRGFNLFLWEASLTIDWDCVVRSFNLFGMPRSIRTTDTFVDLNRTMWCASKLIGSFHCKWPFPQQMTQISTEKTFQLKFNKKFSREQAKRTIFHASEQNESTIGQKTGRTIGQKTGRTIGRSIMRS